MVGMAKWKIWTILALVGLGVIFAAPNLVPQERAEAIPGWLPHRQVSLGLDLLGGSYLLLQVDVDAVMKERLTNLIDGVRTAMRKERIIVSNLGPEGGTAVTFKVRDGGDIEKAREAVRGIDATTQVTTQTDGTVKIQFDQQQIADLNRKTLTQS